MNFFTAVFAFMLMLNPFALFLYLKPVMQDLTNGQFRRVFFQATLISFLIFLVFYFFGDFIFENIFQINFEAFRIFGGVILFSFAYLFIVRGQKGFIQIKEDLDDLASEIALPFMVGAGTISLSILIGEQLDLLQGLLALTVTMILNYGLVIGLKEFRGRIEAKKFRVAFDKNMEILTRINGFFIGAIGVNMIAVGLDNMLMN